MSADALLDEAFDLLRQEEEALAREDVDSAAALAEKRAAVLGAAWSARDDHDPSRLAEGLKRMHQGQRGLVETAERLQARYLEQRANNRRQARYFDAGKKLQAQRDKSFYCDKIS
jgi:hypothetical protein